MYSFKNFPSISSELKTGWKHHIGHSAYIFGKLIIMLIDCCHGNEILCIFKNLILLPNVDLFHTLTTRITVCLRSTAIIRSYNHRNNLFFNARALCKFLLSLLTTYLVSLYYLLLIYNSKVITTIVYRPCSNCIHIVLELDHYKTRR